MVGIVFICTMRLINRQTPNPITIKDVLDIPRFGGIVTTVIPPFVADAHSVDADADAHSQAEGSANTIPVFIRNGRNSSLNAASAKNPPTGVIMRITRGNVSGITEKPIIVPKPSGSRRNESMTSAREYPRQALNIFLCASQKSTVNPSEITASTIQ